MLGVSCKQKLPNNPFQDTIFSHVVLDSLLSCLIHLGGLFMYLPQIPESLVMTLFSGPKAVGAQEVDPGYQ